MRSGVKTCQVGSRRSRSARSAKATYAERLSVVEQCNSAWPTTDVYAPTFAFRFLINKYRILLCFVLWMRDGAKWPIELGTTAQPGWETDFWG